MVENKMLLKGYCIRCGREISFNIENPYCIICGGSCSNSNRYSTSEGGEYFCHGCREQDYISSDNIFCDQCKKKFAK